MSFISKRQIANNIVDNLLDLDLLNIHDYGSAEIARAEAVQSIMCEIEKYLIITGDIITSEDAGEI